MTRNVKEYKKDKNCQSQNPHSLPEKPTKIVNRISSWGRNRMKLTQKSLLKTKKDILNKCDICDETFEKPSQVRRHKAKTHKEMIAKDFQVIDLNQHLNNSQNELPQNQIRSTKFAFQCQFCELGFSKQDILHRHIRVMHEGLINGKNAASENEKNIKICPKNKDAHEGSNQIQSTEEDIVKENFYCEHCEKYFKSHQDLRIHIVKVVEKSHENSGENKNLQNQQDVTQKESCQICGKQFTRKYSLKVHMKVHENRKIQIYNTNEFAIQCQFCELGFSKQDILDRHIRVMHVRSINNGKHGNGQNNEKNIKKLCPSKNKEVHEGSNHQQENANNKNKCELCGNFYKNSDITYRVLHMYKKHFKDKFHSEIDLDFSSSPLKCPREGCTFSSVSKNIKYEKLKLIIHYFQTHGILEKYLKEQKDKKIVLLYNTCEYCGNKFDQLGDLSNHIVVVHSKTNFPCQICSKIFPVMILILNILLKFIRKNRMNVRNVLYHFFIP